jgi:hypothetical protein
MNTTYNTIHTNILPYSSEQNRVPGVTRLIQTNQLQYIMPMKETAIPLSEDICLMSALAQKPRLG